MASPDEPQGASTPSGETAHNTSHNDAPGEIVSYSDSWSTSGTSSTEIALATQVISEPPPAPPAPLSSGRRRQATAPKPPEPPDEEDDEEEGMARMSFLEHLEELRKRLLLAIGGIGVAFFACLFFSDELWNIVVSPATAALTHLKVDPPTL